MFLSFGSFLELEGLFVFPDATGVVLGACDYDVALVVEQTAEYLISMAYQRSPPEINSYSPSYLSRLEAVRRFLPTTLDKCSQRLL